MPTIRFYEIDLFRFIAAVMVVVFHYTFVGYSLNYVTTVRFDSIGNYSRYLYLGINFFFIISGFVILQSASDGQPGRFFRARLIRLYPAYCAALLLTATAIWLFAQPQFPLSWSQLLANLTMLQTAFGQPHVESAYWTLWIELQFYLLIWLLCWRGWLRWLPQLIGLTLVACLASLHLQPPLTFDVWSQIFPHWAGYFALGALLYLIRQQGLDRYKTLLLGLALWFVIRQNWVFADLMMQWYQQPFNKTVILLLNLAFLFLLMPTSLGWQHPLRQSRFVLWGALTYPLYLIHQTLGYLIFNALGPSINRYLLLSLMLLLALLLAWLIRHLIEQPVAAWLHLRFAGTAARQVAATSQTG